MITRITGFQTSDGTFFTDRKAAEGHEFRIQALKLFGDDPVTLDKMAANLGPLQKLISDVQKDAPFPIQEAA